MDAEGYFVLVQRIPVRDSVSALLRSSSSFSSEYELSMLQRTSNRIQKVVKRFRNEVLLAFQVDALCQTALETIHTLCSRLDGEGRMRVASPALARR